MLAIDTLGTVISSSFRTAPRPIILAWGSTSLETQNRDISDWQVWFSQDEWVQRDNRFSESEPESITVENARTHTSKSQWNSRIRKQNHKQGGAMLNHFIRLDSVSHLITLHARKFILRLLAAASSRVHQRLSRVHAQTPAHEPQGLPMAQQMQPLAPSQSLGYQDGK